MWPGESEEYRKMRNALLQKEKQLRALNEEIAEERRALPRGGKLLKNYEFSRANDGQSVKFSDLFEAGKDTLFAYSLMYKPEMAPCPMCVSLLDGLDLSIKQICQRINVAVFARAKPAQLAGLARQRSWHSLPLYCCDQNTYNADYQCEDEAGNQLPILHIWQKSSDGIHHFWASELFYQSDDQWVYHPRHVDMIWPLWNVLDLSPQGRGVDWYPNT